MKTDASDLIDVIRDAGFRAHSYSGRAMYGKECVSAYLDGDGDLWTLATECARREVKPGEPRTDSMGRGIVAYWPGIAWPENRFDRDEGDDDDLA